MGYLYLYHDVYVNYSLLSKGQYIRTRTNILYERTEMNLVSRIISL